jgi:hypothetical protein
MQGFPMECRLSAYRQASPVHHDNRPVSVVSALVIPEDGLVDWNTA